MKRKLIKRFFNLNAHNPNDNQILAMIDRLKLDGLFTNACRLGVQIAYARLTGDSGLLDDLLGWYRQRVERETEKRLARENVELRELRKTIAQLQTRLERLEDKPEAFNSQFLEDIAGGVKWE